MQGDLFSQPMNEQKAKKSETMPGFREVGEKEFYDFVGPQDLTVHVIGEFPYTTEFRLRHSAKVAAKVVESYSDGIHYPIITRFYIH